MKSLLIAAAAAASLAGCSKYGHMYQPEKSSVIRPPVGAITTANLGGHILVSGEQRKHEAVHLAEPLQVGTFSLPAGFYTKIAQTSGTDYFQPSPAVQAELTKRGEGLKDMIVFPSGQLCVNPENGRIACTEGYNAPRSTFSEIVAPEGRAQQALVYGGRAGNSLKVVYRETRGGQNPTDFSNPVEYNLSESTVIAYKGAEVEVLEATNQRVTYRVIKGFSD